MLRPRLQQLLFVREITNKRGRTLRATIGRLIEPGELARFAGDDDDDGCQKSGTAWFHGFLPFFLCPAFADRIGP
jgi:hypothetical protein